MPQWLKALLIVLGAAVERWQRHRANQRLKAHQQQQQEIADDPDQSMADSFGPAAGRVRISAHPDGLQANKADTGVVPDR